MKLFLYVLLLGSMVAQAATSDSNSKTLVWPDGTRYVGGVEDGMRSGKGTIFWEDGSRFVGEFKDDKRHGPGTMILPDGTIYTGYFDNDELVDSPAVAIDEDTSTLPPSAVDPAISEESKTLLVSTIHRWREAWADQDIEEYLEHYSLSFDTPGAMTRKDWEDLRRTRLSRPEFIELDIDFENFNAIENDLVEVRFTQKYNSDTYSDITTKVLTMREENAGWMIVSETSIN